MSEKVECPYCEEYVEIEPDCHYEDYEEYECPKCSKNFEVFAEATVMYSSRGKADCLNGGDHHWMPKIIYPEIAGRGKYFCKSCSAEKTIKDELPTKKDWDDYFEKEKL